MLRGKRLGWASLLKEGLALLLLSPLDHSYQDAAEYQPMFDVKKPLFVLLNLL